MAKKRRSKIRLKRRTHKRKNPQVAMIRKNGKVIGREFSPFSSKELNQAEGRVKQLLEKYKKAPLGKGKQLLFKQLIKMKKDLSKKLPRHSAFLKTLQRYEEDGAAKVTKFDLAAKKEKAVAKKRRKKKKVKATKIRRKKAKSSKRRRKAAKKVAAPKKHRRRKARKSSKRRKHHAKKHAAPKKRRHRRKARKSSKRRRRMISHKHGSNVRHIKKGTSFRFKSKSKRGKRSITVSGRVKVNPYRRNPLADKVKAYTGMSTEELGALALGGAMVPIVNGMISKVPGASTVVSQINSIVGPQAVGSVIPMLVGAALNAVAEHAPIGGQAKKYTRLAGEGLVAAGIIGLAISMSQKYVGPALGLSGINFTPNMRGINFTPNMGIMPQLNGMGAPGDYGGNAGYRQSRADFGIMPQLNGMGDVRNSGDFGADSSSDSDYDTSAEDGDMHTTAMN